MLYLYCLWDHTQGILNFQCRLILNLYELASETIPRSVPWDCRGQSPFPLGVRTTLNKTSFHNPKMPLNHLQGMNHKPLKFHVMETPQSTSVMSQAFRGTTWSPEGAQIQVLCCCGCTLILPAISQATCGWTTPLGIASPLNLKKKHLALYLELCFQRANLNLKTCLQNII